MRKEIKGFIAGVIATSLLSSALFAGAAGPIKKSIAVLYDGIKIYVDGDKISPKDANGNTVEPFTYNGTTYLPVRAISQALGNKVTWDGTTKSIYIGAKSGIQEVTVSTAEEFVKEIGSNKKIILKSGVYDLSSIKQTNSQDGSVTWEKVYDGKELNINNVTNLTIEGIEKGKVEIRVSPRYANIMKFKYVNNVVIKNIIAGHTPQEYGCDAGVLRFDDSENISISGSELYGSGSVGVSLYSTKNFNMDESIITDCSLRAIDINGSKGVRFINTKIIDHRAFSNIISIYKSNDITFGKCEISGNKHFGWDLIEVADTPKVVFDQCTIMNNSKTKAGNADSDVCLFETYGFNDTIQSNILVKNSIIKNNSSDFLVKRKGDVTFENCTIENNTFIDIECPENYGEGNFIGIAR